MNRRITKGFLLALALFGASELVVRVFFARNMSGRFDYGYHPASGFDERADGTVRLVRAGGRRFHPQSFAQRRPDGRFRIMVIGDSVPRGSSLASAYPARLGDYLNERGVKAESFNLACAGYGARRKNVVLQQALKYQPSLVILHVNNSNEYSDEREWRRAQEFKGWHPKNWLMKSLVLRRIYEFKTEKLFWEWLPPEVRNQRTVNDADAEIFASRDQAQIEAWDQLVLNETRQAITLARRAGAKVLLVAQARINWAQPHPVPDDRGLDALCQSLQTEGVAVVSLKQVFAGQEPRKVYADSVHLRPESHQFLAQALAAKLTESGWVQPAK